MRNVLWIAPNLNHYKQRFLNRFVESNGIKLTVLAGRLGKEDGHRDDEGRRFFETVPVNATKLDFGYNIDAYANLARCIRRGAYSCVLMPLERKFFPLILFTVLLKYIFGFRLISYNHGPTDGGGRGIKRFFWKFSYALYDRIVFYTEKGREEAVKKGLLISDKAFYANNTLDTKGIWSRYSFEVNRSPDKTLLFIGRLVENKRIDLLIEYFQRVKQGMHNLRLIIIGDGPMSGVVRSAVGRDSDIVWRGAVIEEAAIGEDMRKAHAVFVPGHTGLSIVHAFCYGKPYVALASYKKHPPEIVYLEDGVNGLLLSGAVEQDCHRIRDFLLNDEVYERACRKAYETAKGLSIERWCADLRQALTFGDPL